MWRKSPCPGRRRLGLSGADAPNPHRVHGLLQKQRPALTSHSHGQQVNQAEPDDGSSHHGGQPQSHAPSASRRAMLTGIAVGIPGAAAANLPGYAEPVTGAAPPTPAPAAPAAVAPAGPAGSCSAPTLTAYQALRDPLINRGLATSAQERATHRLEALLPSGQSTQDVEVARAKLSIDRATTPLAKYQAIAALAETDQRTCFELLRQNLASYLPIVYTPTVADACLSWGSLLPRPTGLYLNARRHAGRVKELLGTWPCRQVRIAVITDGERILGIGDLGAHGMGIPVGKAMVYGLCGTDPSSILPVLVDAGCEDDEIRDDPLYLGERVQRLRGDAYFSFMDEVVQGIQDTWGGNVLIHWEDVSSSSSYRLLARLRQRASPVPTFNDDIECTAVIALATLLRSPRLTGVPLAEQTYLFFGAGQANLGCAELLVQHLNTLGMAEEDARSKIWLFDSRGLVLEERPNLTPQKRRFSKPVSLFADQVQRVRAAAAASEGSKDSLPTPTNALELAVQAVQPTALIGAAGRGGAFTKQVLVSMDYGVQATRGPQARPLVLALSNPTNRAECTYQQAYEWTKGRVVYASGTQFPGLVTAQGQKRTPAQANNCYVFPGLGMGFVDSGVKVVTQPMLAAAAKAIADMVGDAELAEECLLPRITRLPEVTQAVVAAVRASATERAAQGTGVPNP